MGRLNDAQVDTLTRTGEELSGEAMEDLLQRDYKVSSFALLSAKAKAFQLKPFNASNYVVNDKAFEKLDREFCQQNKVLPAEAEAS